MRRVGCASAASGAARSAAEPVRNLRRSIAISRILDWLRASREPLFREGGPFVLRPVTAGTVKMHPPSLGLPKPTPGAVDVWRYSRCYSTVFTCRNGCGQAIQP